MEICEFVLDRGCRSTCSDDLVDGELGGETLDPARFRDLSPLRNVLRRRMLPAEKAGEELRFACCWRIR